MYNILYMDYQQKYLKYKAKYLQLRKLLGGGSTDKINTKEEAIDEIKKLGHKSVEQYGYSLRNPNGSYDGTPKKIGKFTVILTGHPAQSASVYAKDGDFEGDYKLINYWAKDSGWVLLDSFGDH